MRKVNVKSGTRVRRVRTSVLGEINAIRRRVKRKNKKWDSVKLVRAVRDGR